ncbi:MAG: cell division protein ZapA [Gammaproteobacteria bacterium]
MKSDKTPTVVKILDKEYRIACEPDEISSLKSSAQYLHDQMKMIRDKGNVIGGDRIAVMAALNITHELLHKTTDSETISDIVSKRIKSLREKVEVALNQTNQLEL